MSQPKEVSSKCLHDRQERAIVKIATKNIYNKMKNISNKIALDFNKKMDENRKGLRDNIAKIRAREEVSDDIKKRHEDVITEMMNRMEVSRRVFNNYVRTGKVEVPD